VVSTTRGARYDRPSPSMTPGHHAVLDDQVLGGGGDDVEVTRGMEFGLHGLAIELAVDLGARAAHGGTLGAVQHPKLDAGLVGHAAHDAVQGVDLTDQMALAQAADGRVAGHLADGLKLVGQQQGARARRAAALAASQPA
jgi:hypothetical protein